MANPDILRWHGKRLRFHGRYIPDSRQGTSQRRGCDQMTRVADQIMKRVSAHERGTWVCTPKDFLDLGSREAVDQALVAPRQGGPTASDRTRDVRHAPATRPSGMIRTPSRRTNAAIATSRSTGAGRFSTSLIRGREPAGSDQRGSGQSLLHYIGSAGFQTSSGWPFRAIPTPKMAMISPLMRSRQVYHLVRMDRKRGVPKLFVLPASA